MANQTLLKKKMRALLFFIMQKRAQFVQARLPHITES